MPPTIGRSSRGIGRTPMRVASTRAPASAGKCAATVASERSGGQGGAASAQTWSCAPSASTMRPPPSGRKWQPGAWIGRRRVVATGAV